MLGLAFLPVTFAWHGVLAAVCNKETYSHAQHQDTIQQPTSCSSLWTTTAQSATPWCSAKFSFRLATVNSGWIAINLRYDGMTSSHHLNLGGTIQKNPLRSWKSPVCIKNDRYCDTTILRESFKNSNLKKICLSETDKDTIKCLWDKKYIPQSSRLTNNLQIENIVWNLNWEEGLAKLHSLVLNFHRKDHLKSLKSTGCIKNCERYFLPWSLTLRVGCRARPHVRRLQATAERKT